MYSNYGTQNIGLDWLFGTFAARESDVKGQCKNTKDVSLPN